MASEWLRLKGLPEWADYLEPLEEEHKEREEYLCV